MTIINMNKHKVDDISENSLHLIHLEDKLGVNRLHCDQSTNYTIGQTIDVYVLCTF